MEDSKIIALYFDRRESALAETAKKYGAYLNQVVYRILGSREDVEVVDIRLGYTARSGYAGEWILRPAWIFDYAQTTDQGLTQYGTLTVRMEDGILQNLTAIS